MRLVHSWSVLSTCLATWRPTLSTCLALVLPALILAYIDFGKLSPNVFQIYFFFIVCWVACIILSDLKSSKVVYSFRICIVWKNQVLHICIENKKFLFSQSFEKASRLGFYLLNAWSVLFCICINNFSIEIESCIIGSIWKVVHYSFWEKSLFVVLNFLTCVSCIWCVYIWLEETSYPLI
jgi:hypothetical protein